MKLLRLAARNYRSWKRLDLDASALGLTCVVGPNGAGKSALIDLPRWVLFGTRQDTLSYETKTGGAQLWIDLDGDEWCIERGRKDGNPYLWATRLALAQGDDPEVLQGNTIAETQALIDDLLGLKEEVFRATAYCRQGEIEWFAKLRPAERKEVLAELLGLGFWDGMTEWSAATQIAAMQKVKQAEELVALGDAAAAVIQAEEQNLEIAEQTQDWLIEQGEVAYRTLAAAEQRMARLGALAEAYERERLAMAQAVRQHDWARAWVERSTQERDAAEQHLARAREVTPQELAELEEREREQQTAYEEWEAAVTELRAAERESVREFDTLARLRDRHRSDLARVRERQDPRCPLCQQELTPEGRQEVLAELEDALATAQEALESVGDKLGATRLTRQRVEETPPPRPDPGTLVAARDRRMDYEVAVARVKEKAEQLEGAREQFEGSQAALEEKARTFDALGKERDDLALQTPTDEMIAAQKREIERLRQAARENAELVGRARERISTWNAQLKRAEEARAELPALRDALGAAEDLTNACGRDGVPALIAEAAVGTITDYANEVMERFGSRLRLGLRTQRESKKGNRREALDLVVEQGAEERPYENFSGGERYRISLALRVGLSRLAAERSGRPIRTLLIDEVTDLDAEGLEALPELLAELRQDFDTILVVTHLDRLRDALPQTLSVTKDDEAGSQLA